MSEPANDSKSSKQSKAEKQLDLVTVLMRITGFGRPDATELAERIKARNRQAESLMRNAYESRDREKMDELLALANQEEDEERAKAEAKASKDASKETVKAEKAEPAKAKSETKAETKGDGTTQT